MHREQMVQQLKSHVCEVTFTKVNGDERVMTCTLMESHLPVTQSENQSGARSNTAISVWDVNAEGWRSFRVGNVQKFVPITG